MFHCFCCCCCVFFSFLLWCRFVYVPYISSFHWFWPLFSAHFFTVLCFICCLSPFGSGSLFLVLHLISHVLFVVFFLGFSLSRSLALYFLLCAQTTFFWWIVNIFMKSVCSKNASGRERREKQQAKNVDRVMATAQTSIPTDTSGGKMKYTYRCCKRIFFGFFLRPTACQPWSSVFVCNKKKVSCLLFICFNKRFHLHLNRSSNQFMISYFFFVHFWPQDLSVFLLCAFFDIKSPIKSHLLFGSGPISSGDFCVAFFSLCGTCFYNFMMKKKTERRTSELSLQP